MNAPSVLNDLLKERIVILDGAVGTMIQARKLQEADYRSERFRDWTRDVMGNNDLLNLTQPGVIQAIHREYLEAGADIIETNTFNSTTISMADYGMETIAVELNLAGARNARAAADAFMAANPGRTCFVAGALGPTNKTASLSPDVQNPAYRAITYDELVKVYYEQTRALVEGGVDLLLVETCQDILQAKCALYGVNRARRALSSDTPVACQVTIDVNGAMLLGTEIGAALATLEPFDLEFIGMNCATGPELMNDAIRYLGHNCPRRVSCQPNAGLPRNEGGRTVFPLSPEELAKWQRLFVTEYGVSVVGGCCGTTPAHLKAVAEAVAGLEPKRREPRYTPSVASCYTAVPLDLDPKPVVIA